ncbi:MULTISPECIES: DNA internalization-related competence protein ComEC/Rec2 [unclassified Fibrobacter]|uniref:DNA internalization-related competence protein ComEC/Rec2 n=1 Tax=unclassified Fibrobacter TaxID=2634177 RepID=UPI0025BB4D1A|nr:MULTISPECIES: DNA internalization-related competence protein ComEC/Rec2 [unclassified Fibrobacter]
MAGKPALVSALTLMAVYASLDFPGYAPFLLIPIAVVARTFHRSVQCAILFTLICGCVSHTAQAHREHLHAGHEPSEIPAKACGNIESLLPRPSGTAFIVKADSGYRLRITEKRAFESLPEPGDSICFEAQWYPVTPPTVPGAFDTREWLRSQGFAAYGKFRHWTSWHGKWTAERSFYAFRQWIKRRFEAHLDPAETGLLLGLLAGDRSGIPDAIRNDFQRTGLVHVLAISGFHVVLLAGILSVFLKATRLPHKVANLIAIALLFVYVPVTGGSPAVKRAVLMFAIPQLGTMFGKPANTFNSLGVALLFILLPDPSQLWNPGFQLSATATAGILLGNSCNPFKSIPEGLRKSSLWKLAEGYVLSPTYVTLCATLATAPFLIHHFKTLSPLAWLGNIIIVPLVSWGMQAGLFALLSPIESLCDTFCAAAGFFLRMASFLTRLLSDSSGAAITVGPFSPAILLLLGALFALLPAIRKNAVAKKFGLLCLLLFSAIFCVQGYMRISHPSWNLTLIDVGQGDSILLTTPSGKHILVDSGDRSKRDMGKDVIVPFLRHSGIQRLDALVITHPDLDHFGGASSILRTFPVKELWINECSRTEAKADWQKTIATAADREISIRDIGRGFTWREHRFEIQAVHPNPNSTAGLKCSDANQGSITLRAHGLGHSAMLTGDLTAAGEKEILASDANIRSDILKLGHHGSKTSSSAPFLDAVAPQLALISSGRKNRFRHPSKQVIERLDSLHIPYLNTATSGTVFVTFSADTVIVEPMLK